jgi:hypothetical protein
MFTRRTLSVIYVRPQPDVSFPVARLFIQFLRDHFEGAANFIQQIAKVGGPERLLGIDHDVGGGADPRPCQAYRLPQAPSHPVAIHSTTQGTSDREPDPQSPSFTPPQVEHGHVSRKVTPSLLVDALEIRMPQNSPGARILPSSRVRGVRSLENARAHRRLAICPDDALFRDCSGMTNVGDPGHDREIQRI